MTLILFLSFFSTVDGWVRLQGTGTTNYYLSPESESALGSEVSWILNLRGKNVYPFYRGSFAGYPTTYNFENTLWQEAGINYKDKRVQSVLSGVLSLPGGSYSDFGYAEVKGWINSGNVFKIKAGGSYRNYFWSAITDNFEIFSNFSLSFKTSKIEFLPSVFSGLKIYSGESVVQDSFGMGWWRDFKFSKTVSVQSTAFRFTVSGVLYFYPDAWTTLGLWFRRNLIFGDSLPDWSSLGIISDRELFQSPYNYDGWEIGFSLYWDLPFQTQFRTYLDYSNQFYPYSPVTDSAGNVLYYGRSDDVFYIQNELEKRVIGRLTLIFEFTYARRTSDDYFRNYNALRFGAGLRLHI